MHSLVLWLFYLRRELSDTMATEQPHCRESIRARHRKQADGGVAPVLFSEQQTVMKNGTHSLSITLSKYVRKTHDVAQGDAIRVETYPEGVFVVFEEVADD